MSHNWIMSVSGRAYGPYTALQMATFAAQGRLISASLVARTGQRQFSPATQDPEIAAVLDSVREAAIHAARKRTLKAEASSASPAGIQAAADQSRFVIVAEMKSGSVAALERAIFDLGPAHAIAPQAWLLSTALSVAALRNLLVQKLGRYDQLFVVDATNDKLAWTNYAPEAEVKVRRIWKKPAKTPIAA